MRDDFFHMQMSEHMRERIFGGELSSEYGFDNKFAKTKPIILKEYESKQFVQHLQRFNNKPSVTSQFLTLLKFKFRF